VDYSIFLLQVREDFARPEHLLRSTFERVSKLSLGKTLGSVNAERLEGAEG